MQTLLPLAHEIGALLKQRGETVAIAESSSGGLISAALLAVPGASTYYRGGGVIYTAKARVVLLGIQKEDIEGMRSSSEPYAQVLARTVRTRFDADWGLSETGAAGPTGNGYGDAAGHTCVAVSGIPSSGPIEIARTLETTKSDRAENMRLFAADAMEFLLRALSV